MTGRLTQSASARAKTPSALSNYRERQSEGADVGQTGRDERAGDLSALSDPGDLRLSGGP